MWDIKLLSPQGQKIVLHSIDEIIEHFFAGKNISTSQPYTMNVTTDKPKAAVD